MLNNVQVLRAVAALMVVLVHIQLMSPALAGQTWMTYGKYGVDIFFVISGFVMVYTTSRRTPTPREFFANRVIRIVPMYWAMTLAVYAVAIVAPSLLRSVNGNIPDLLKSLFFVPYDMGIGRIQPILFVGWTLNYEMFFYAVFALSLVIPSARVRIGAMVALLAGLTTIGMVIEPANVPARFFTSSLLLEFGYGMLLGYWHPRMPGRIAPLVAVGLVLLGAAGMVVLLATTDLPRGVAVGVPSAAIVLGTLLLESHGRSIANRTLLLLGAASYATYLSHAFVVQAATKLLERMPMARALPVVPMAVLVFLIVVAIGIAIHLWFERPVDRVLRARMRRTPGRHVRSDAVALWPWKTS